LGVFADTGNRAQRNPGPTLDVRKRLHGIPGNEAAGYSKTNEEAVAGMIYKGLQRLSGTGYTANIEVLKLQYQECRVGMARYCLSISISPVEACGKTVVLPMVRWFCQLLY